MGLLEVLNSLRSLIRRNNQENDVRIAILT
jgi:hypothetical protein